MNRMPLDTPFSFNVLGREDRAGVPQVVQAKIRPARGRARGHDDLGDLGVDQVAVGARPREEQRVGSAGDVRVQVRLDGRVGMRWDRHMAHPFDAPRPTDEVGSVDANHGT